MLTSLFLLLSANILGPINWLLGAYVDSVCVLEVYDSFYEEHALTNTAVELHSTSQQLIVQEIQIIHRIVLQKIRSIHHRRSQTISLTDVRLIYKMRRCGMNSSFVKSSSKAGLQLSDVLQTGLRSWLHSHSCRRRRPRFCGLLCLSAGWSQCNCSVSIGYSLSTARRDLLSMDPGFLGSGVGSGVGDLRPCCHLVSVDTVASS